KPGMIGLRSPSSGGTPASTILARLRGSGPLIAVERPRLMPPKGGGRPPSWQVAQARVEIAPPVASAVVVAAPGAHFACAIAASPWRLRSGDGTPKTSAM